MPRKAFVVDLQDALATFHRPNVSELKAGAEDGLINFDYHVQNGETTKVAILIPDLGEYPSSHLYMIYTDSDHVPRAIHEALDSMESFAGIKIPSMLASVVRNLDKATLERIGSQTNPIDLEDADPMVIGSDRESEAEEEPDADSASDDGGWSPKSPDFDWNQSGAPQASLSDRSKVSCQREKIQSDLRLAREAGFRVSCQGSLLDGGKDGFVSVSIRVNKLGISDEALQAWHMGPEQYFVLLIRYADGYQTLDSIEGATSSHASNLVTLRVGLNHKYKWDVDEVTAAFTRLEDKSKTESVATDSRDAPKKSKKIARLFIARPLDELLNERFLPLLRYRMAMGFPWHGAEEFFNDHQGRNLEDSAPDPMYWADDQSDKSSSLRPLVIADHLTSDVPQKSLPLLAMQFALRHLVRCTEFCLVCHCKVETDFEALKPYVCSKPLCLYQYMNLGFGPSIEHEIVTQPYVVDLLVSFCYASASAQRLRFLPTGMALMVPNIQPPMPFPYTGQFAPPVVTPPATLHGDSKRHLQENTFRAKFDPLSRDMLFAQNERPSLQRGSWVVYGPPGVTTERYHAKVAHVLLPTVHLEKDIPDLKNKSSTLLNVKSISQRHLSGKNSTNTRTNTQTPPIDSTTGLASPFRDIEFTVYDQNFDELNDVDKASMICTLLDTLPKVKQMKDYLLAKGGSDASLRSWHDRISPAALGILRWIIASNRSCIVQVDSLEDSLHKSEERVFGMPGWMQFRLAQGAPDKEQRFVQSIRKTTATYQYPTIFAWHGSPLHNWHGIVREGLHFEKTDHGRAFGNGVYHALEVSTSLGYSGSRHVYGSGVNSADGEAVTTPGQWPASQLRISQALTLNEIVNAPEQYVSKSPHLVVAQLDWIQSRYLFVMCHSQDIKISDETPTQVLDQDPAYHPMGARRNKLVIPLNAISKSRRPDVQALSKTNGDRKRKADEFASEDVDLPSDDTDVEDIMIFIKPEEVETSKPVKRVPPTSTGTVPARTDFVPGSHDSKTLPLIAPPSYATSSATRTLQRELTATLKVQDTHPLHELGWFIDPELITNMYQWIIELHTFESHLPLARDMKDKNLKSIVLEIRFGKDYPMSPPFVRIIRPRFLGFNQGGGGHVTAGGALCMELLTNSGWSAVSNIESVLLQVRLAMSSTDPKPARLEAGPVRDYGVGEAVEAYIRACNMHGWQIPPDFRASYSGGGPPAPI